VRLKAKLELMRIELGNFSGLSHEAVEAVAFLIDDGQQVFALRLVEFNFG
jgi:hypothetical protein